MIKTSKGRKTFKNCFKKVESTLPLILTSHPDSLHTYFTLLQIKETNYAYKKKNYFFINKLLENYIQDEMP